MCTTCVEHYRYTINNALEVIKLHECNMGLDDVLKLAADCTGVEFGKVKATFYKNDDKEDLRFWLWQKEKADG